MAQVVGKVQSAISFLKTHILNKDNPHGVTIKQIGAAASSHTHSMSSINGTLPVSKGGTGVDTVAALKALIQQYAGGSQGSGFNPFLLTLGDAVVEINGDDVSISLADMGITETQFEEITQEITWAIGYAINVKTGALETTSSRTIYYAQIPVVPGEEVRLRGWFSYNNAAYCVYDANDVPLTWDVGHEIPYVTREMYITLDFTVPPGSSYMVICNYNARVDRGLDEYALSIRNGNN